MTREGEAANPIVFTGLRGMGKTALLRHMTHRAQAAGAITIVGEADLSLRFVDVVRRELASALQRSSPLPTRLATSITRVLENLPKISYDLPHDAGGFAISSADAEREDVIDTNSLEDTLLILNEQLHRHGHFLMIGLDEIQESVSGDLLRLIRVVHKTAGTKQPMLFLGAGLPNSASVLKTVRTYTERWAYYRLELLSREETFQAVDIPARQLGERWSPEALEEIFARSLGYPYFIQAYAAAAWRRHAGNGVTLEDVSTTSLGVQKMLDESVFDHQFDQLTPHEMRFVLALYQLGAGPHRLDEIANVLGVKSSADLSSTRTQLLKKDVIFASARGLAEFRLPLTIEYIARRLTDFTKRARLR